MCASLLLRKGIESFFFPAMLPSPRLLVRLATAGSGRWSDGRRGGFLSSSVRAARMAVCVQWIQGAGDGPRCWLLQLLPSSWGPAAWRKEDLAGLPSEGVAEDDDGDITVCVNTLCTGVFPAKKQRCTVCLFNTVPLSKKKVSVTCGTLYRYYQLILTFTLEHL